MKKLSPHVKAIMYGLAGFTLWVAADCFMKLAGEMHVPGYEIVGVASAGGMLVLYILTAMRGRLHRLRPQHYKGLSVLGFCMILTYALVIEGLRYLPLVDFYTIIFMAPLFGGFAAIYVFHETMEWQKVAATSAGFVGVLIAINIFMKRDQGSWLGYAYAFADMIVIVGMQMVMRFLGGRENRESTAFYPRLAPVLACAAAMLIFGYEPMPLRAVAYAFLIGAFGSVGWFCAAEAYSRANVATVAPYQYSQIVTGAVIGYLIWGHLPSLHLLAGAAIIIAAGIYMAYHTHRSHVPELLEL